MTDHAASLFRRLQHTPLRDALRGRLTARLDLERVFVQSNAPQAAIERVRRVVRKAHLWRSERVEVAEELLAHFVDGQDAGTPPEELLERFGNENKAAKLIRRAKRRQRPRVWHALRVMFWSVTAVLAIYVWLWVQFFWSPMPTSSVDYLAQINTRALAVPVDQRAWPLYEKAWEELETIQVGELNSVPKDFQGWSTPDHEYWPVLEEWLSDHQDAIAKVRAASKLSTLGVPFRFSYPTPILVDRSNPGPNEVLPPTRIQPQLTPDWFISPFSNVLIHDASLALRDNDSETFIEDVFAILRMAEQADSYQDMSGVMLTLGTRRQVYWMIAAVLEKQPDMLTTSQWRDLAHEITRFDAKDMMRTILEREHAYVLDMIQRSYTGQATDDGYLTRQGMMLLLSEHWGNKESLRWVPAFQIIEDDALSTLRMIANMPIILARTASRQEIIAEANQIFDSYHAKLDSPPWRSLREPEGAGRALTTPPCNQKDFSPYWPMGILFRPTDQDLHWISRLDAQQLALLTAIALELYRREHDAWPNSLHELTPSYLPTVPSDPMTGEPLMYRIHEAKPLIYSVGTDGDDDGGRAPLGIDDKPEPIRASNFFTEPPSENTMKIVEGDWVLWPMLDIPLIHQPIN